MNKWRVVRLLEKKVRRGDILRLISGEDLGVQKSLFEGDALGKLSDRYKEVGVGVMLVGDKNYPEELGNIADPPVCLFYKGEPSILKDKCVAVIGSRDQSPRGIRATKRIVPELVKQGFVIVSGLALGTDSQAHRVCLGCGGKTVAVMPVGLDMVYPARHQRLAEEIVDKGGLLLSEYPFGTEIFKFRFLERNRIVSGLSRATLVVEAGKPSGATATANFAIDQGREVWVSRGRRGEKNSEGILNLIEDGARII